MEKRVLVTIAISIGIIVLWFRLFPPPKPATPTAPPPAMAAPATPAAPTPAPAPAPAAGAAAGPASAPKERPPEQQVVVQRDGLFRAVFSTHGAAPTEFTLLDPQYKEKVWVPKPGYRETLPPGTVPTRISPEDPNFEQKLVPIDLVRRASGGLPFAVSFSDVDLSLPADQAWSLERHSDDELVYATDVGRVHVEKRWTLPRTGYRLGLVVTVENRGDKPLAEHLQLSIPSWQDPLAKPSGMSFGRRYNLLEAICHVGRTTKNVTHDKLLEAPLAVTGDVTWAGVGEQFFLVAAAFAPEAGGERACHGTAAAGGRIEADVTFAERRVAPGQKSEHVMAAYLGPKLLHELDDVRVLDSDPKLGDAVQYGLWGLAEPIARPMLWLLRAIQRVVVNWGLAIICITILLKLVMFFPTQKSMKSMRQMQALKPDMDRIKARYPDDKAKQNQEVMNLYKEKGINPLGGCLPTVLQMPIYIAFYSMLSNAVQLYRASFVGPIDDMTASFWPLAVVTGALMFAQQRLAPQSPDSQQQKMMMYMMPIMFMGFTIFLPSGLTLYILTNTVLGIAQQWYFNQRHPLPKAAGARVAGAPTKA